MSGLRLDPRLHRAALLGAALAASLSPGCRHAGDPPASRSTAGAPSPARPAAPASAPITGATRAALQRALVYLARDGRWWMDGGDSVPGGGGCVSCHHVAFALWSHREAQRAAVSFDGSGLDALEQRAHRYVADRPSKPEPVPASQLLLGRERLPAPGRPPDARWTALLRGLVDQQEKDGHWQARGQFSSQRRPSEESDAVATMWILAAFGSFQRLDADTLAARGRAYAWLQQQPEGVSNEWLAARLLVERQLGASGAAQRLRDRLVREQRADGGWSWVAGEPSNAFSSGQTLYALAAAGVGADHPALRRGVAYLLAAQNGDGTWSVDSKLTSRKDGKKIRYIYEYWGTAWAVIGLARTL
jgi:hypothetical protein